MSSPPHGPTGSAGWAIAIRTREREYTEPECTNWIGIIQDRRQRNDGVMEFSVRISTIGRWPKVFLVIGEAVTSFRDKYTGLDPAMERWKHTPQLALGDAVMLSGRIIGLPPTSRKYNLGMLEPSFSFWAHSMTKVEDPKPAIATSKLTEATAHVLKVGLRLHRGFAANPDNTREQDDAMKANLAKELGASEDYVSACYLAYVQYRGDGVEKPSDEAAALISSAWGLEE